MSAYYC